MRARKIPERLALLSECLERYERYWDQPHTDSPELQERRRADRRWLNKNFKAIESAVNDTGGHRMLKIEGVTFDPLRNFLTPPGHYYNQTIRAVIDLLEETIGTYEHLGAETGLVNIGPSELDFMESLERSLRVAFKEKPKNEAAVQDVAAVVLTALWIPYTKEQDSVNVGVRTFRPDFVLRDSVPLEIKLVNSVGDVSRSQEEIAADIAGYRNKWKDLIFLVYDCGFIVEPHRYKESLSDQFGVSVIVVKH